MILPVGLDWCTWAYSGQRHRLPSQAAGIYPSGPFLLSPVAQGAGRGRHEQRELLLFITRKLVPDLLRLQLLTPVGRKGGALDLGLVVQPRAS